MEEKKKIPEDLTVINLADPEEIEYWTERLCVNETQLRLAIFKRGNLTERVIDYLFPGQKR